jgi:NitT/TauT family transport system ATP-binding protein
MLRIVAGLDDDYEGRIGGSPRRCLGMVFQEPRLLPWRTVEQNVRLVAPDVDDAALQALFEVLELGGHRAHYPGELSLGLARRVALARAFAVGPDLLILDEPFVSMDEALATKLRDELAMLVDRNPVTTLLVTHDVEEAARLADRVFVMSPRPARILAEVSIEETRAARTPQVIASIKAEVARRITAGHPSASRNSGGT